MGPISNFGTCVQLADDGSAVVEYLRVFACTNGIQASGIVNGNVVEGYGSGVGIQSSGSINGNVVFNSYAGIVVYSASKVGSTVTGNTITLRSGAAGGFGLELYCPSTATRFRLG